MQPVQHEPGLNGFAQSHFVRQQHPRNQPRCDVRGDGHLVRQQIHTTTDKSAHLRLAQFATPPQCLHSQVKRVQLVHLSCEQAVLGPAKARCIGEQRLRDFALLCLIREQPAFFLHSRDHRFRAIAKRDCIARRKPDAT